MAELPRLRQGVPIGLTEDGKRIFPHPQFILFWQQFAQQLEAVPAIAAGLEEQVQLAQAAADTAQDAANTAQAAADTAQAAADGNTQASSLTNSYPANYTSPLISLASTGSITIANHTRIYGDPSLNPNVSITGATFASGFGSGEQVYIYYVDPTRSDTTPTFLASIDPGDAAQTGSTHSVGSGIIPAAGSQDGSPTLPPGVPPA